MNGWAVLEQMGHFRSVGIVTEVEIFGAKMGQIAALKPSGEFVTKLFSAASIYCLTLVSEDEARSMVRPWQSPRLTLTASRSDEFNPFDDGEDEVGAKYRPRSSSPIDFDAETDLEGDLVWLGGTSPLNPLTTYYFEATRSGQALPAFEAKTNQSGNLVHGDAMGYFPARQLLTVTAREIPDVEPAKDPTVELARLCGADGDEIILRWSAPSFDIRESVDWALVQHPTRGYSAFFWEVDGEEWVQDGDADPAILREMNVGRQDLSEALMGCVDALDVEASYRELRYDADRAAEIRLVVESARFTLARSAPQEGA